MKKVNLILVGIIGIVVIALIVVLFFVFKGTSAESEKDFNADSNGPVAESETAHILSARTKTDIESLIKKAEYKVYTEDDYYYLYEVPIFDTVAEIEVLTIDEDIDYMNIFISLFEAKVDEGVSNEEPGVDTGEDIIEDVTPPYDFSDEEKNEINKSFENVKNIFEKYIDCGKFEQCDLIPTRPLLAGETMPEDDDKKFYQGYVLKEYSVRDEQGTLWLMQYEASNGTASVSIQKMLNETGFEGYIPIIDMTKNN